MRTMTRVCVGLAALSAAAILAARTDLQAQQAAGAVNVGINDIGGVVTGPGGPEAGVWVIAETIDLPTKFAKMVVTDDQGRYLIPELPNAKTSCGCVATVLSTRRRLTERPAPPSI
jgi:hypothetical protein